MLVLLWPDEKRETKVKRGCRMGLIERGWGIDTVIQRQRAGCDPDIQGMGG